MLEFLRHVFGWVCGQNPAHTWSPGGELLPLCQRCTGVYAGAFAAALLHLAWRPAPTPRWLWLNGAFLLFMLPSGFYWIPQTPELRCGSGILFGYGLVAFLWRREFTIYDLRFTRFSPAHEPRVNRKSQMVNVIGLLSALVLVPLLAENGNPAAAVGLSAVCAGGALALAALLAANLFFLLRWLGRRMCAPAA
jgi:uncharacterized membrane protein